MNDVVLSGLGFPRSALAAHMLAIARPIPTLVLGRDNSGDLLMQTELRLRGELHGEIPIAFTDFNLAALEGKRTRGKNRGRHGGAFGRSRR